MLYNTEYEVLGIIEYFDWIFHKNQRSDIDETNSEAHLCLQAHLEKGIKDVLWSCGRSVVLYQTEDEKISRFGVESDPNEMRDGDIAFVNELEKECPLRSALDFGHQNQMTIMGHLCMNRHYGGGLGNCMTSLLARRPDMWEIKKDGTPDKTRLCFALADYREERLAIIEEIARLGVDGVCLDFVRQPPMVRYHPAITEDYKQKKGIDPAEIDLRKGSSPGEFDKFRDWCKYRSGVLTDFMRGVRKKLRTLELELDRNLPLYVRITDNGFTGNMISGIDIETWCKEGLVDGIITHPLQWIHGLWIHDLRPYVELGRKTGVKVIGGVNTYSVEGWEMNPVCIAERVREQYEAGVAGISLYETNDTVIRPELNIFLDAIREYGHLLELLNDKDWLKKWPVHGLNANCGMDNHSGFSRDLLSDL